MPDPDTLWGFRKELRKSGVLDRLFARLNEAMRSRGLLPQDGQIVEATFVEVPKQRNSREGDAEIKEGRVFFTYIGAARTKAAVVMMMNRTCHRVRYEQIVRWDRMPLQG